MGMGMVLVEMGMPYFNPIPICFISTWVCKHFYILQSYEKFLNGSNSSFLHEFLKSRKTDSRPAVDKKSLQDLIKLKNERITS